MSKSTRSTRSTSTNNKEQFDGNSLNINILFIVVIAIFLFMSIKGEIIPISKFTKQNFLNTLDRLIPNMPSTKSA
jgi:hypothetical protein